MSSLFIQPPLLRTLDGPPRGRGTRSALRRRGGKVERDADGRREVDVLCADLDESLCQDPYDPPLRVEDGAARVARVCRRVDLDLAPGEPADETLREAGL